MVTPFDVSTILMRPFHIGCAKSPHSVALYPSFDVRGGTLNTVKPNKALLSSNYKNDWPDISRAMNRIDSISSKDDRSMALSTELENLNAVYLRSCTPQPQ